MNLDDKFTIPAAPGELPGQSLETTPKGAKRRKNGGANGSASRKSRKAADDEESADEAAALTMGAGNGDSRQRKKMLFEPAVADTFQAVAPLIGAGQRDAVNPYFTPPPVAVARPVEPAPVATKSPEVEEGTTASSSAAVVEAAPESPEAPPVEPAVRATEPAQVAETKGAVFQVATLVLRSSQPEQDDEELATPPARESAPTVDSHDEVATVSPVPPTDASAEPVRTEDAPAPSFVEQAAPETPAPDLAVADAVESALAPTTPPQPQPEPPARERPAAPLSRSEAIAARTARMSALNGARSPATTQQPMQPAARAPEQQRPTELPVQAGDIYGYWTRIKNGRRFPSRADFDAEQVAEHWPNSMLLTCDRPGGNSQVAFSSVLRLGANRRSRPGDDLSFTSMITEWILSIGGEAARAGKPVQDTEVFPTPDGTHAYKIVALPLSDHQTHVDHVLCHLSRS